MIRKLSNDVPVQQPDSLEVEHSKQTQAAPQSSPQEAEHPLRSESTSAARIAEMQLGGAAYQASLQSQLETERRIPDRDPVPRTIPTGLLSVGSQGPEVQNLQNQLNEWRAANGKPPISADGIFGPKTEAALKEFQQATGLDSDGIAGPRTADRFRLENNPNFQKLDPEIKNIIRNNVDAFQNIPGSRENLIQLATSDRFVSLSSEAQKSVLGVFFREPQNPSHMEALQGAMDDMIKMQNDPAFAKLDSYTQRLTFAALASHSSYGFGRESIMDLVRSDQYLSLKPELQERIMSTIAANPSELSGSQFQGIFQTKGFLNMSEEMKAKVVDIACRNAGNPSRNVDFSIMLADPSFVNASADDQWAQLNAYAGKSGVEINS